jgi:hypothetical protein
MFRTELNIAPANHKISLQNQVISIGSCFSENIGERLKENKFKALANPLGIVYNPVSLFNILNYACNNTFPPEESYVKQKGIFYNLELHSDFSHKDPEVLRSRIEKHFSTTHEFLKSTEWLIITLGTANVYEYLQTGNIVNNCHKIPAKEFTKKLLSPKQIVIAFEFLCRELKVLNNDIKIIFTISPVRHLKETLEGNMLSKAILRVAIEQLKDNHPGIDYFPSYEIMMDDLRDYRFYNEDMIHPSKVAIDYIWEKFIEKYFDPGANQFLKDWEKILKALQHKPFHPDASSHQEFLKKTIEQLYNLQEKVDITEELEILKRQVK